MLPIYKYLCTVSHFDGKRLFKKGLVYLFSGDPGSNFTQTEEDPFLDGILPHQDLDGTVFMGGNVYNYDDISFSSAQSKTGSNLKPDYDQNENGFAFPQNDTAEVLYLAQITTHRLKVPRPGQQEQIIWFPHFHYWQDEAQIPTMEYRYRIVAAGAVVPDFSAWIASLGTTEFAYTSGKIHQIISFPAFDAFANGLTSPACALDVQLRRNDNVVAGDIIFKAFDFHAPFDAPLGSGQQFIK